MTRSLLLPSAAALFLLLGTSLALIALFISFANASRPSWRAETRLVSLGGPKPSTGRRNLWSQCVKLSVDNDAAISGSLAGSLTVKGGFISKVLFGNIRRSTDGSAGLYVFSASDEVPASGSLQRAAEFCVDYETSYSIVTDLNITPNEDYVELQSGTPGVRRLQKRDGFVADWSSGQCKCLFQGVARADVLATGTRPPASSTARASSTALAPAPAPAAASTTTKLASTTQAQVTQTTTKQTTTTSFTKTTSTTTATPLPPSVSNVGGRSAPAPSSSNSTAISVSNPVFSGTAQPITSSVVVSVYYAPDSSPSSQTLLGTCTSTAGTGAFSFTAPSLSDGTYFFTVSSPAGSNAYKIVIDTVTPPAPVLSSINGQNPSSFTGSSTSLLTFEGTARPGDTVHVLANNDTVGSNVTDSNSRFLVTSDSLDDGKYVYSVRAQSYSGAESTPVFANNGQNVTIAKPTAAASQGCLLMNESFTGTSVIGSSWIALNNACLTGTNGSIIPAGSGNNIPGCPSSAPIAPAGYLQLTSAYNWQSGAILINDEIRGGDGFEVTMDMLQYGGSGADGIAFFLVNGDANLTKAGGFGGSLGYAQYNGGGGVQAGVSGGYVGVGFDAWGNYARDTEGRGAATAGGNCSTYSPYTFNTSSTPNAITVRGPGQDMKGYCWLASAVLPSSGTGARSIRAGSLANALRTMRLTVSPTDSMGNATVKVEVDYKDGVGWRTELSMPAPKPVPDSYKLGVTSGTGAANDYHLIRNLIVKSRKAC